MEEYERKIVLALRDAMSDEGRHIRKLSKLKITCFVASWLMMFASFFESLEPHIPLWAISSLGILGGLMLGLGIYLDNSIKQWPKLKSYLNYDKIHEKAKIMGIND